MINLELQTLNDELEQTAATVEASPPISILQKECVNKKGGQKTWPPKVWYMILE